VIKKFISLLMGFDLEKVTKEYNQKQQQLTAEYVAEVSSSIKAAENQVKDCDFTILRS